MDNRFREFSYRIVCRNDMLVLAILWIIAFTFGMFICSLTNPLFSSLMCSIMYVPVSIVGLVCVLFIPLSISAIAVFYGNTVIIFLLCYIRAFCFGCFLYSVLLVFNSGGLFFAFLLMFSSVLSQIILLWFWFRWNSGTMCLRRDFAVCIVNAVIIGSLDYFCISPFLQVLIHKL